MFILDILRTLKSKKGFTLIELIVSLGIFCIVIVFITTTIGTIFNMERSILDQVQNSMKALSQVELQNRSGLGVDEITIDFEGAGEIVVSGTIVSKQEKDISYTLFIPN